MRTTTMLLVTLSLLMIGCEKSATVNTRTESRSEDKKQLAEDIEIQVRKVSLKEYQQIIADHPGKVVLVDFWATWCAPCVEQFPHTLELDEKYADKGFAAISMSCDKPDNEEPVLKFLQRKNSRIQNLRTDSGASATFEQYDIRGGIPFYKLYDRKGKLRYEFGSDQSRPEDHTEPIDKMESRIEELLAE